MSELTPDPLECTLPIAAERTVQQFSPDAIYQAAARGYTDDLRVGDKHRERDDDNLCLLSGHLDSMR